VAEEGEYGLSRQFEATEIPAPDLPWRPRLPENVRPRIALIGAGGITEYHLKAYSRLGLDVVGIANRTLVKAQRVQQAFYPTAEVTSDYRLLLERDDVEIVDVALPPEHRPEVIRHAIKAGKQILSQKPFAVDLDVAEELVQLAQQAGVRLAVNQNGRWAPHFAWIREAVRAGLIGEVASVDFQLAFDHGWTVGTPFEEIHHLILYDFGVHWFDMAACLLEGRAIDQVYAAVSRAPHQAARPPFVASALLTGPDVQARLTFNAAVTYGQTDRTLVTGSLGTIEAFGPSLSSQQVVMTTAAGRCSPALTGNWFENGFEGAMAELICAIAENREPSNSAHRNLRSLALCFAALASADSGQPVRPGVARRIPS
jgi:predicted dehydrogenase